MDKVLEKINYAKSTCAKILDLSVDPRSGEQSRLSIIPNELLELNQIEFIDLSNNAISELPDDFFRLTNLKNINLSCNVFAEIPDVLSQMPKIDCLNLCNNPINVFPYWLCKMQALKSLSLGFNGTRDLPDYISEIEGLEELALVGFQLQNIPEFIYKIKNLKILCLHHNWIETIPSQISSLGKLNKLLIGNNKISYLSENIYEMKFLNVVDLSGNKINNISKDISQMEDLETLNLGGNLLTDLPLSISKMAKLSSLLLYNNLFVSIPKCIFGVQNLRNLDFSNYTAIRTKFARTELKNRNRLRSIPADITNLSKLTNLGVLRNNIISPPMEIVSGGLISIKKYYEQIKEVGVDYLYEAKLLVVGEGGAGKTTLTNKILNSSYELKEEDTTQGIDIVRWGFRLGNGKYFHVNIWDFGGQEIYHATHQFFLTKRSVYVLVADTRREDTDFYYWLNVVELLSDNSPVMIIKNEKQDRLREIGENQLKGAFTNVKEIFGTNLATNRGLDHVIENIKRFATDLPHIGDQLPSTWVIVRSALENEKSDYISIENYYDICEAHGFKETKAKDQLSEYLHDIGVCLHFKDDELLRKIIILKPKWGTVAVYKVLDNMKIITNSGYFTSDDLVHIWDAPEYVNMHNELLRLMINFKLCYQVPNNKGLYLAPQLLTSNQPNFEWKIDNNLIMKYSYEFMPKGIITQFIVRMHDLIVDHKLVWKDGVVIEKDGAIAEIIENLLKREIRIRVSGANRRDLMTIVMYELDKIQQSFNRLRVDKLIPCNCSICKTSQNPHFYKYGIVKQYLRDQQEKIQCQKSYHMVPVLSMVDEVFDFGKSLEGELEYRNNLTILGPISRFNYYDKSAGGNALSNRNINTRSDKSSWANGTFYLFCFVVVLGVLGYISNVINLIPLVVVIAGGLLFVPIIGAFQLRQDGKLTEKSFIQLVKIVISSLPIFNKIIRQ